MCKRAGVITIGDDDGEYAIEKACETQEGIAEADGMEFFAVVDKKKDKKEKIEGCERDIEVARDSDDEMFLYHLALLDHGLGIQRISCSLNPRCTYSAV